MLAMKARDAVAQTKLGEVSLAEPSCLLRVCEGSNAGAYSLTLHSQLSARGVIEVAEALALHSQDSALGVEPGDRMQTANAVPAISLMSANIDYP